MRHHFAFLVACGTPLEPTTGKPIAVIGKVHVPTERGLRQYLGRALREGCTPAEGLDALPMALPRRGLSKIVWAVDIVLALDLPGFQPGAPGSPGEWHDVTATRGFEAGNTQRVTRDGRGLCVHRAGRAWRVCDSRCPHPTTDPSRSGRSKRCTLTCRRHQSAFERRRGACIARGSSPLPLWPSKVVKGRLLARW